MSSPFSELSTLSSTCNVKGKMYYRPGVSDISFESFLSNMLHAAKNTRRKNPWEKDWVNLKGKWYAYNSVQSLTEVFS